MSAVVKELLDADSNKLYPVTKASATYMDNGTETVQQAIELSLDGSRTMTFPSVTEITDTLDAGYVIKTVFNNDGTITETTYDSNSTVIKSKTTTFNSDGSIRIEVQ